MGKKKRQGDPSRDDCESTDEDGESEEKPLSACPHVGKAANISAIKKTLKIAWVKVGQCTACIKESKVISPVKKLDVKDAKLKKDGRLTMAEIRKEQLERAKAEQRAAAEKLKKDREIKVECVEEKCAIVDEEKGKRKEEDPIKADPPSIWLCLKCGTQGCGNTSKKHSFGHYKAPRSDLHCLAVNVDTWSIWCYECQTEIYVDSHKKLYEAVEYIKKIKQQGNKLVSSISPKGGNSGSFGGVVKTLGKPVAGAASSSPRCGLPLRVKGLNNLGNTCFFNSVMQCLNQTHLLTHLLDIQAAKGVTFKIPGSEANSFSTNEDSESENDSNCFESFSDLSVQLAEGGPMVTSLAAFFKEMNNVGKTTTYSPGHLFTQVVRQAPKFRGMQQQDSHELLRYLMDGLRNEEQKRQKSAILKNFGLTEKTDPKSVARVLRHKLKVYGRQANHTLLDKIFSGQLVSTIVCEECHYSSRRYEQFLDISLPVVEDKPHKPLKKSSSVLPDDVDGNVTCCGAQEQKKSKSKAKKEKSRRRKEKNKRKNSRADSDDGEKKIKEELQGDEAFEKVELKPVIEEKKVITSTGFHRMESVDWKDKNVEEEEGYEEGEEENPGETEEDWEWDYGEANEDKQVLRLKPTAKNDEESINEQVDREKSSERTRENSEDEQNETGASSNGDVEDNDEDDLKKKWVLDENYLNSFKTLDDLMNVSDNLDPQMEHLAKELSKLGLRGNDKDRAEKDKVESEWTARTLVGLAPRYQAAPGECSIYSCLNSFTQSELLTGSNKWACDRCTEVKARNPNNSECSDSNKTKPATVYSSASKQMLVFSPPAILTLQLKRFQQTISGCKKINKLVSFPLELDLAAFCSSTCVSMPNMEIGEKSVLYSLYGVVEHSGSLRGGHYVCYVKARAADCLRGDPSMFFNSPLDKAGDVPTFLAEIDRKIKLNLMAVKKDSKLEEEKLDDVANNNNVPRSSSGSRKWFHVSDSSVSEVGEEKVLKSQAYLLFYERIS